MNVKVEINEAQIAAASKNVCFLENEDNRRTLIEAANEGLASALRRHFAAREREPHVVGWWNNGATYPKRYFWRGTRGNSVAEKIRTTLISPARMETIISIDSPALAHKLDPNAPAIRPGPGKQFLAIPASPEAAQWTGMPRDFPTKLRFERWRRPNGSWIAALVARSAFLNKGGRLAKEGQKKRRGQGQVVYWLVHQVRTRFDPAALPSPADQALAVNNAVATAISRLLKSR